MTEQIKHGVMGRWAYILLGAALALLSFSLSALAHIDVGMGSGMTLSLMDVALHTSARWQKAPWQILCFVVPVAAAQALIGNYLMLPCTLVVRLVCVLAVAKVYRDLPDKTRESSILPFLVHGFWLLLGVTLYNAFMFGLIRFLVGILTSVVEWVIAGGLSVVLMRYLSRHVLTLGNDEEAAR